MTSSPSSNTAAVGRPSVPLSISRRTRGTPFTERVEAAGVSGYTVYNHMLLPTGFCGVEADYWHLRSKVQLWDVACERQLELRGPDSYALAQLMTVRDLSTMGTDRCVYAPLVDARGRLVNDPVVLPVDTDRIWISIADSDVGLWADGLASGLGLDVDVFEAEVAPLAVQGPLADDVLEAVFGPTIRELGFFRFGRFLFEGHPFIVSRTGYSTQGGVEIYVDRADLALPLWDAIMAAGEPFDIGPGAPNLIERIEGGLLSYGNDMTIEHSPLECALDRYCSLDAPIESLGLDALRRQRDDGVHRRIRGITIDGDPVSPATSPWPIESSGQIVGSTSSTAWSPRLRSGVGIAMIDQVAVRAGTNVTVHTPDGTRAGLVVDMPFPGARPG